MQATILTFSGKEGSLVEEIFSRGRENVARKVFIL